MEQPSLDAAAGKIALISTSHVSPATSTPTKAQLVTLPTELTLEIIKLSGEISVVSFDRLYNFCPPSNYCPLYRFSPLDHQAIIQLSLVNKHLRALCTPIMFETMELWCKGDRLLDDLRLIEDSPILNLVRYLDLRTNPRPPTPPIYGEAFLRQPWPRLTPLLSKFLGQMTNVIDVSLSLEFDESHIIPLRKELKKIVMPSVQRLEFPTSRTIDFIPAVFPQLRVLDIEVNTCPGNLTGLAVIAPQLAQKLHTLCLYKQGWAYEHIREVAHLFPNITVLLITGTNLETRNGDRFEKVSYLVSILKRLRNLKHLGLTNLQRVAIGPETADIRGNFFLGGEMDVAKGIFNQCPELLDIYFQLKHGPPGQWYYPIKEKQSGKVVNVDVKVDKSGRVPGLVWLTRNYRDMIDAAF